METQSKNGRWARAPRARGFSLVEVLVAVLVLALGMLGIASLQATALRNSQSALERSQGVMQTYTIIDAMRANRPVALIGGYNLASWTCNAPDTGPTLVEQDLNRWITSMQSDLGANACGRIVCGGGACRIDVRWDDTRGLGGDDEYEVTTRTRI